MALNNKEEIHFWRELERVEQWLSTGSGAAAGRIYDTMGRPGEQTFANYGNELVASVARVERVRHALDQSGPIAKRLAMQQLSGIGLDDVRDILLAACKEIALYYGGAVVTGAVVGGAIGSLAFGAGAVPGAVVGGAAGSQVGIWVLTLLGLKELVVGLGTMFPAAMEHYVRGFREAWGAVPDNRRDFGNSTALPSGSISAGAWHMGQGHVILVTAILSAVVAYLTRGGGTTASLAQMARQSRRLGAKFANWAVKNEGRLLAHPQLQSRPNNSVAMAMEESVPKNGRSASGASGSTKADAVGENSTTAVAVVNTLPVPRVDVSDKFEIVRYNGVMDVNYLDAEFGTHGLNAYIDKAGRLSFEVRAGGDASKLGSGTDMFASMMSRLNKKEFRSMGLRVLGRPELIA